MVGRRGSLQSQFLCGLWGWWLKPAQKVNEADLLPRKVPPCNTRHHFWTSAAQAWEDLGKTPCANISKEDQLSGKQLCGRGPEGPDGHQVYHELTMLPHSKGSQQHSRLQ